MKATLILILLLNPTFSTMSRQELINPSLNEVRNSFSSPIFNFHSNLNSFSKTVTYPTPPSTNDIIEEYIYLNYPANKIDHYEIVLDEYEEAVIFHDYGNHVIVSDLFNLNNDVERITINVRLIDNEAPFIKNGELIKISYTELNEGGFIDLTKFIDVFDYTDGVILLDNKYSNYKPEIFKKNKLSLTLVDSLNNKQTYSIEVEIIDDVPPTIMGEDYIELYQYEITKKEELISYFDISDNNGSGIKEVLVVPSSPTPLNEVGMTDYVLIAYDYYLNKTTFPFRVNILDGIGDVYFKNLESIEVYKGDLKSPSEIVNILINENKLEKDIYESIEFITTTYSSSFDQIGTYETRMVLTKYNAKKLYISFEINVVSKPNPLIQFFINLFNKIIAFFRKLFNL